jgi:hypothetical protein
MRIRRLNFRERVAALMWARRALGVPGLILLVMLLHTRLGWLFAAFVVGSLMLASLKAWENSVRRQFIRDADLPPFLVAKVMAAHRGVSERDAELVMRGLRQFFMAHLRCGRKFVAMPSKAVDTAWHEFILHTRGYQRWCNTAFGAMLHHTPAEVLGRDPKRNDGLRRTWYWSCKEESVDPRKPSRLPLLFALDAKLHIKGGFRYQADCKAIDSAATSMAYCGTSFSESSSDSGAPGDSNGFGGCESSSSSSDSGSSDSGSSGSDSGSCGGGCGGGGGGD